jgi:hypothetical protein
MSFPALALAVLVLLWASLGGLTWLLAAAWREGQRVLFSLPLAVGGAIVGGLLVPALERKDGVGVVISLGAAALAGLVLTIVGLRIWRPE